MADNYLNNTGLTYYHNRISALFATQAALGEVADDLSDLSDRVDDIVAEGGEPNVIETVKVNGTALTPDANKAVDVTVPTAGSAQDTSGYATYAQVAAVEGNIPTATSDLTNDGDGDSPFATEDYVDENGGKIDIIYLNGDELPISADKEVSIDTATVTASGTTLTVAQGSNAYVKVTPNANGGNITTKTAPQTTHIMDFVNKAYVDGTFRTETQVQTAIDAALADITGIDFEVVQSLPATGEKGVIYLLANSGSTPNIYDEYIWIDGDPTGSFEKIGTTDVDLSQYWAISDLTAITTAQIDTLFA